MRLTAFILMSHALLGKSKTNHALHSASGNSHFPQTGDPCTGASISLLRLVHQLSSMDYREADYLDATPESVSSVKQHIFQFAFDLDPEEDFESAEMSHEDTLVAKFDKESNFERENRVRYVSATKVLFHLFVCSSVCASDGNQFPDRSQPFPKLGCSGSDLSGAVFERSLDIDRSHRARSKRQ